MAGLRKVSVAAGNAKEEELRAVFADTSKPEQERAQALMQLYGVLHGAGRYKRLLAVTTELADQPLPRMNGFDLNEYSHQMAFTSATMLRRHDDALKLGERFLERYPASQMYRGVEMQMQSIIDERRRWSENRAEAEKALLETDARLEELAKGPKNDQTPYLVRLAEFQRCSMVDRHTVPDWMLRECAAFAKKHQAATDSQTKELVNMSRMMVARAHYYLGQFAEARAVSSAIQADAPEFHKQYVAPFAQMYRGDE